MKRSEILFGILRIPMDLSAGMLALFLAYRLREAGSDLLPGYQLLQSPSQLPPLNYYFTHFTLPSLGAFILIAAALKLYSLRTTLGPWREIGRVATAALIWFMIVMAWFFLIQRQLFFSRVLLIQATVLLGIFSIIGRMAILLLQRSFLRKGIGVRAVLSCGGVPLPESIRASLGEDLRYNYLGHVRHPLEVQVRDAETHIDQVLHTDANPTSEETNLLIDFCRSHHVGYAFVPPVFSDVPHQLRVSAIGLTPILRFEPTPLDGWGRVWKRLADLLIGTLLLIIATPALLSIAVLVLLTSGRPVFYVSRRVGQYRKQEIPLLKFRTMVRDADAKKHELTHLSHRKDGPLFKVKQDPRVTPLGKILRRLSLDELPQLLNVVLGHLSLVGPRPHLPDEVSKYSERDHRVFAVRPGVTGLAQISGRSDLTFEQEMRLDMRYIEDWSLHLDLWILWRTAFVVLFGGGAD